MLTRNVDIKDIDVSMLANAEMPVAQFLPYRTQLSERVVQLRDGQVMSVIKLGGLSTTAVSDEVLNRHTRTLNLLMRYIADPKVTLWHHAVKRKRFVSLGADVEDDYAKDFLSDYKSTVTAKPFLIVEHYISVVVKKKTDISVGLFDQIASFFKDDVDEDVSASLKAQLSTLNEVVTRVVSVLTEYRPQVLGVREEGGKTFSEIYEFLYYVINGHSVKVPVNCKVANNVLPTVRPVFKKTFASLHHQVAPTIHVKVMSVKEHSNTEYTAADVKELIDLPFEYVLCQTFEFQSTEKSLDELDKKHFSLNDSSKGEASEDLDDIKMAKSEVRSRKVVYGTASFKLLIKAESTKQLNRNVELATKAFSSASLMPVSDDFLLELCYYGLLPGNSQYITRAFAASSMNFACFSSMHTEAVQLKFDGFHWGEALFTMKTRNGAPFNFQLHVDDVGHTFVLGKTGSGKTVIMTAIMMALHKARCRTFYFDKDRGAEIAIKAVGGSYLTIQPGVPTGMNPCQLPDSPSNRAYLSSLLKILLSDNDGQITDEEAAVIQVMVNANYQFDHANRRLRNLKTVLPNGDDRTLMLRFSRWIEIGEHAWMFDNEADSVDLSRDVVGFDMTHLLGLPEIRGAGLSYLIHLVETKRNGDPLAVMIDEGWAGLDDEYFAEKIKNYEKVGRKQNILVLFGTNDAADLTQSQAGRVVAAQSVTRLFGYDDTPDRDVYIDRYKLTEEEYHVISRLKKREFLLKQGGLTEVVTLDLSELQDHIGVLSGNDASLKVFDRLVETLGEDRDNWLPRFRDQYRS